MTRADASQPVPLESLHGLHRVAFRRRKISLAKDRRAQRREDRDDEAAEVAELAVAAGALPRTGRVLRPASRRRRDVANPRLASGPARPQAVVVPVADLECLIGVLAEVPRSRRRQGQPRPATRVHGAGPGCCRPHAPGGWPLALRESAVGRSLSIMRGIATPHRGPRRGGRGERPSGHRPASGPSTGAASRASPRRNQNSRRAGAARSVTALGSWASDHPSAWRSSA